MPSPASQSARNASITALCIALAIAGLSVFGVAPRPAAANTAKVCGMLSLAQLRSLFGKTMVVIPTQDLKNSKSCVWGPPGSTGTLTVQVADAKFYRNGKPISGIGDKAFLENIVGEWVGGAVKGKNALNFFMPGAVSQKNAVQLLKTLVARM